uniref:Uncharacterized protein n=1 Tax=Timema monikensis TaxID=170555 RepID=A0A7R9EKV1_9NEOP|nr:unnamed protein product [Timema monikensis]
MPSVRIVGAPPLKGAVRALRVVRAVPTQWALTFRRNKLRLVIQTYDEEDAVSIREAKVATYSSTVVSDSAYVKSYFGNLPGVIVSLEARDLPLIESVKIMHTIQEGVKQTPGPVASSVATKLEQVLQ